MKWNGRADSPSFPRPFLRFFYGKSNVRMCSFSPAKFRIFLSPKGTNIWQRYVIKYVDYRRMFSIFLAKSNFQRQPSLEKRLIRKNHTNFSVYIHMYIYEHNFSLLFLVTSTLTLTHYCLLCKYSCCFIYTDTAAYSPSVFSYKKQDENVQVPDYKINTCRELPFCILFLSFFAASFRRVHD